MTDFSSLPLTLSVDFEGLRLKLKPEDQPLESYCIETATEAACFGPLPVGDKAQAANASAPPTGAQPVGSFIETLDSLHRCLALSIPVLATGSAVSIFGLTRIGEALSLPSFASKKAMLNANKTTTVMLGATFIGAAAACWVGIAYFGPENSSPNQSEDAQ